MKVNRVLIRRDSRRSSGVGDDEGRRRLMADQQEEPATEDRVGAEGEEPFLEERRSRQRTKVVAPIKAAVALKVAGDDSVTRAAAEEDGAGDRDRDS
jgi:hypothetical protein